MKKNISLISHIRPIRHILKHFTSTRRRKILSTILAVLIMLTSIRFIFFNPKEAKAAFVELTTSETTVQIDVANRYRAILQKGDTDDYLLFYDRAENDSSPDDVLRFRGPRVSEEHISYYLSFDDYRKTSILESNSVRVRVRVEGCLDTSTGGQCLQDDDNDGSDDVVKVTEEYTFTAEGISVATMFDFRDNGVTLDNTDYTDFLYVYSVDLNSGTVTDAFSETVLYGDGDTENSRGAGDGDGVLSYVTDIYVVGQATGNYQDVFFGETELNGDRVLSNGLSGHIHYDIDNMGTEQDMVSFAEVSSQTLSGYGNSEFFLRFKPQDDLDSEDKREALFNDLTNPDTPTYTTGNEWNEMTTSSLQSAANATAPAAASPGLNFGGSDDYVSVTDPGTGSVLDFGIGESITISAWIYPTSFVSDGSPVILTKGTTAGSNNTNYALQLEGGGGTTNACALVFNDEGSSVKIYASNNSVLVLNQWQHLAATYTFGTANSAHLYLNGVEQAGGWVVGVGNETPVQSNDPLWIGANNSSASGTVNEEFTGKIEEVRLFSTSLTQTQIQADMFNQISSFSDDLVANWRFNENTGIGTDDETGNGLNGGLNGNVSWTTGFVPDQYNEAEGYYTVDAEDSRVNLDIDGGTYTRHDPGFKIRSYRENSLPGAVTLEGRNLVEGSDYNAAYKPFTSAYFADELTWYSTLDSSTAVTSPDIGTAGTVNNADFVAGKYGNGARFDADGEYVSVSVTEGTDYELEKGAFEFWYQPSYGHDDTTKRHVFWLLNYDGDNMIEFEQRGHLSSKELRIKFSQPSDIDPDCVISSSDYHWNTYDWVHLRVAWDDSESGDDQIRIFMNNEELTKSCTNTSSLDTSGWTAPDTLVIGNNTTAPEAEGIIDEFKIYSNDDAPYILAKGGNTSDSDEYLADEDNDYSLDFEADDAANRGEYIFLGSDSMFSGVNIDLATNGAGSSLDLNWQYWNGSSWVSLESISGFTDGTSNLTQDGTIQWDTVPTNWRPYSVNGSTDLYYIRAYLESGSYTTSPKENLIRTDIILLQFFENIIHKDQTFEIASGEPAIAYWRMDEGYGTTAHDSAGNNHDADFGTSTYAPAWKDESLCLDGKCLEFDGSDDYLKVDDHNQLDFSGDDEFTIEAWIRHGPQTSGQDVILAKYETSGGDGGYKLLMESDGDITFGIDDDNSSFPADSITSTAATYDDNRWHHVVGVKNGTTLKLYIDAILVGTDTSLTTASLSNNDDLYIGIDADGTSNPYDGFLDETKIYRYARTANQIKSDYLGGIKGLSVKFGGGDLDWLSQGLIGYWKMDETSAGSGQVDRSDSSGNGYTLTDNETTASAQGKYGNGSEHVPANTEYLSNASTISGVKTISFWSNPDTLTNYFTNLTSSANIQSDSNGFLSANGFSSPKIYVNGGESTTISVDTWQLVTVTSDTAINADQFYVGKAGSNYFDGTLDEVRLYNRELSPSEVLKLYKWAPGPVGWWKMDEGTGAYSYDSSGNNNTGSLNSPLWVNGKIGQALKFDGSDDFVNAGTNASLDITSSITLEAWINPTTLSQASSPELIAKSASAYFYRMRFVDGGYLRFNAYGTSDNLLSSLSTVSANAWTHIAMTYDGAYKKIYINGVLNNQEATTGTMASETGHTLYIGGFDGSENFNGSIDDVRIYNYARTPSQIVEDINAGHPAPGSPVGSPIIHYKFDEGDGTTANNSGSDTTLSATCSESWTSSGKVGRAFNVASSSNSASAGDVGFVDGLTEMAVSFWIKPSALAVARNIIGKWPSSITSNSFKIGTGDSVNDEFRIFIAAYINDASNYYETSNLDLTTSSWQHIVVVYNGGNSANERIKVYKNSRPVSGIVTGTIPTSMTSGSTSNLIIGDVTGQSAAFTGIYDEVKIYNFALTENQVKLEYNQGMSAVMGATGTESSGATSWSNEREFCPPGDTTESCAPLTHWKLDENTGTLNVSDSSGNNHTGTLGGVTQGSWVSGKFGQALQFDGSTTYITKAPAPKLVFPFTLSAWVNTTASGSTMTIFGFYDNAVTNVYYDILMTSTGLAQLRARTTSATSTVTINDGKWHHIVGVFTSNTSRSLYVDGMFQATNTGAMGFNASAVDSMDAGWAHTSSPSQYFSGKIDDLILYNYARTQEQISWDYNRSKPVGWWRMDECSDTTLYDASGNSNDGTITIGGSGDQDAIGTCTSGDTGDARYNGRNGKYAAAMSFDGGDDYASAGSGASIDNIFSGGGAISAWVYLDSFGEGGYGRIADKGGTSTASGPGFFVCNDGGTNCTNAVSLFQDFDGASEFWWSSADNSISTGVWTHIVVVYNSDSVDNNPTFYINGVISETKESRSSSGTVISDADQTLFIGNRLEGDRAFDGLIDDLRLINYTPTREQVLTIYNEGSALRFGN